MGFRDIHAFNMALLAKQGWCLQKNHESLFYKVFKEKYISEGDFLNANLGSNPSYAWRSVWNAQPILRDGIRWLVGNGRRIRKWKDKWIPNSTTLKVVFPQSVLDLGAKVSELINEERGAWNQSLVNRTFLSFEAETILCIPLSPLLPEDSMIWANTMDGKFTVRVYKLAIERNAISKGESSNNSNVKTLWNRIWKVEVPGKVKNFMWRTCVNILPTKLSLFRRQLAPDDICQECGSAQESTGHVLCLCERAKEA